jgi:hypothetical protein
MDNVQNYDSYILVLPKTYLQLDCLANSIFQSCMNAYQLQKSTQIRKDAIAFYIHLSRFRVVGIRSAQQDIRNCRQVDRHPIVFKPKPILFR